MRENDEERDELDQGTRAGVVNPGATVMTAGGFSVPATDERPGEIDTPVDESELELDYSAGETEADERQEGTPGALSERPAEREDPDAEEESSA